MLEKEKRRKKEGKNAPRNQIKRYGDIQGGQTHTIPKSALLENSMDDNAAAPFVERGSMIEEIDGDDDMNDPDQCQVDWLLRTLRMIK